MIYMDDRYRNDVKFAQLVDMLFHQIKRAEFTPTEIREAAMLAQIKFEAENPRLIMVSPEMQERMWVTRKP